MTRTANSKIVPPRSQPPTSSAVWKTTLSVLLLAVITWAAYANGWPDQLILDDKLFLEYAQFLEFASVPRYFFEDVWSARSVESGLYRPMLFVSVLLDTNLFGNWFAGYHMINILLHIVVTLLVYVLIGRLLKIDGEGARYGSLAALLAAVVFGVHPMHTEVVNSVFNRSILLEAMGSLSGLWWLLRFLDSRPVIAWAGLFLAYLFALFSRETAIVLPGLAAGLILIYSKGPFRRRLRKCLPVLCLLIPMALYLAMRDHALTGSEQGPIADETSVPGFISQVDASRLLEGRALLDAAGTWAEALGVLAWPFHPKLHYSNLSRHWQWAGLFIHLGLLFAAWKLFRNGHLGLIAGLYIFYVAFLPASQLFGAGTLEPHLAERYLYLPSVGLAIILAYAVGYLRWRFDPMLAAATVTAMVLVTVPVTWARNSEWADELTLFEAEYARANRSSALLRLLTAAHLRAGNLDRVIEVCAANPRGVGKAGFFNAHCASAFSYTGQHAEAEKAYLLAAQDPKSRVPAYTNLAQHYLRQGRWGEARVQFENAVDAGETAAQKAYQRGYMMVHLYPQDRQKLLVARGHFKQALELNPRLREAQSWLDRLNSLLGSEPAAATD